MALVRHVCPEFASELVELWLATFKEAYTGVHSPANIEAYCSKAFTLKNATAELSDEDAVCAVYFRDERPLGFCLVKHRAGPVALDGNSSELKQLYIRGSEYGSGVGPDLFDEACRIVRSAGRRWLWLAVSDKNCRAQAFYARRNVQKLVPGPVFEVGSDRLTSTIMALDLDAQSSPSK